MNGPKDVDVFSSSFCEELVSVKNNRNVLFAGAMGINIKTF